MQPLHANEARWFFQWDRLELCRGIGLSLCAVALMLLALKAFPAFSIPVGLPVTVFSAGFALALLAEGFDRKNGTMDSRKLRCRRCGAKTAVGKMWKAGWKCAKCRTVGRFDNI